MGQKKIRISIRTGYTEEELHSRIRRQLNTNDFTYQIDRKSLDARKKNSIRWDMQIIANSRAIAETLPEPQQLTIPYKKNNLKVVVIGSGPAGFFCAYLLQKAGFNTTIVERGDEVIKRNSAILSFEKSGIFNSTGNYAFGEGGAGTFSDGKLTSRTKNISKEKQFILKSYVKAGAPEDILYMAHPHLGSDNLISIE